MFFCFQILDKSLSINLFVTFYAKYQQLINFKQHHYWSVVEKIKPFFHISSKITIKNCKRISG